MAHEDNNKDVKEQNQKAKKPADKKPNGLSRAGKKLKETFSELKRVSWPTFGKALKATGIVLGVVVVFLLVFTGVNYGFTELLKLMTKAGGV